MFCARCLRSSFSSSSIRRPAALLTARTYAAAANPNQAKPPLQPSTPADEPLVKVMPPVFSAPLVPAPAKIVKKPNAVVSGTPAGTPLKHINYLKGKSDPMALEDSEYPDWLWTLLGPGKATAAAADGEAVGDLYSKSRKERKIAKKRAEKAAAIQALDSEIRIPISEQTIDLPFTTSREYPFTRVVSAVGGVGAPTAKGKGGARAVKPSTVEIGSEVQVGADEAVAARLEVRREMRKKSRAAIKEKNFLSTLGR